MPGTGKTTVARKMGKLFRSLELLPTDEVIETSASGLITGYHGQSGKQTNQMLEKACGKVLFIDEAYQLNPHHGGAYMKEVVDEIVKGLTSTQLKGKMVVILAGYETQIDQMLITNPGLRSRFSRRLRFEPLSPDDVVSMLTCKMTKPPRGYTLSADAIELLPTLAEELVTFDEFGNGRDIETWCVRIENALALRLLPHLDHLTPDQIKIIQAIDLQSSFDKFKLNRKVSSPLSPSASSFDTKPHSPSMPMATMDQSPPPPTIIQISHKIEEQVPDKPKQIDNPTDNPDKEFYVNLQSILDELGLNTEEGVRKLSELDINSEELENIAKALVSRLKCPPQAASAFLLRWRKLQKKVQEQLARQEEEKEKAKAENREVLIPIWRCGVCGRADMPWIVCYVAPFVVRFEKLSIAGSS